MPTACRIVEKKNLHFHTLKEVRERKLMWCDSTTDSIVWMGEDERRID